MKMFIYCFYVLILFLCSYTIHMLLTNTIQQHEVMKIKYHVWIVYENKSWQQQQVMKTKWNIWIVYGHKMAGKYLLAFGHIVSWKHETAFFQFLVLSFNNDHFLLLIFFFTSCCCHAIMIIYYRMCSLTTECVLLLYVVVIQ